MTGDIAPVLVEVGTFKPLRDRLPRIAADTWRAHVGDGVADHRSYGVEHVAGFAAGVLAAVDAATAQAIARLARHTVDRDTAHALVIDEVRAAHSAEIQALRDKYDAVIAEHRTRADDADQRAAAAEARARHAEAALAYERAHRDRADAAERRVHEIEQALAALINGLGDGTPVAEIRAQIRAVTDTAAAAQQAA